MRTALASYITNEQKTKNEEAKAKFMRKQIRAQKAEAKREALEITASGSLEIKR